MKPLNSAWMTFKNNKKFVVLFTVIDFLFFFVFFKTSTSLFLRASDKISVLNGIIQGAVSQVQLGRDVNSLLLGNPEFVSSFGAVVNVMVLWVIVTFVLWVVFQGTQFFLTKRLIKKIKIIAFIKSFVLVNVVWLLVTILIISVITLLVRSSNNPLPLFGSSLISVVSALFFFVLGYAVFVSYAVVPKKNIFKKMLHQGKKWHVWLTYYLGMLVALVILGRLIPVFGGMHFLLLLLFIILIFLPFLTFVRMVMVELD
jgi:hypothetical protein